MEIKFKSQASIAGEQATIHLERTQHILTSMGRGAADKLQEACRSSKTILRKLLANSLDAMVVANGNIAKFKSQASIAGVGRGAADKLQEARRTGETILRKLLANSLDAIVVANGKIAKFKSQASIAGEQATIHLERTQHILTSMGRGAADKLQEACRSGKTILRKLLANSLDAMVVANGNIAKFKSQASIAGVGRGAADKLQEARRTGETILRKLLANSLDAIVVANGKIAKFKSQASIAGEQATIHFQRVQKTLTRLGRNAIDKPRRLQKARRRKENDLRKLLANSLDAIVVTNGDRRLVYANPKALDLFGVSELNMRKFTIDTFLSHCQIPELRRKWFAKRRDERYGKCKIRRLDGCSRVAEYISVANVIPHRYLYRFLNVAPPGITQLAQKCQSATLSALGDQLISAANVTKQVKPKSGRTRSEC